MRKNCRLSQLGTEEKSNVCEARKQERVYSSQFLVFVIQYGQRLVVSTCFIIHRVYTAYWAQMGLGPKLAIKVENVVVENWPMILLVKWW